MFIVNTAVTIFYITTSCRTSVGNCKFGVNHFLLEGLKTCLPGKYSNSLIKSQSRFCWPVELCNFY